MMIKKCIGKFMDSIITIVIDAIVVLVAQNALPLIFKDYNISIHTEIFILCVLFMVNLCILLVVQKSYHRYKFYIKDEKITMEYLGDTITVLQKFCIYTGKFRANKMYTRKTWYSNEHFSYKATTDGYSIASIKTIGNDYEFNVVFPKNKYFHLPFQFETVFTGENRKRQYLNCYEVRIECPTDKITIEVRFPIGCCNNVIKKKEFLNHENAPGHKISETEFNGVYVWVIEKPKVNWSYCLEWEWSDKEKKIIRKRNH